MSLQNRERQTVNELIPAVGQNVSVRFESVIVHCRVMDAKSSYGKVRLLVTPLDGCDSQWIELSRLTLHIGQDWSGESIERRSR